MMEPSAAKRMVAGCQTMGGKRGVAMERAHDAQGRAARRRCRLCGWSDVARRRWDGDTGGVRTRKRSRKKVAARWPAGRRAASLAGRNRKPFVKHGFAGRPVGIAAVTAGELIQQLLEATDSGSAAASVLRTTNGNRSPDPRVSAVRRPIRRHTGPQRGPGVCRRAADVRHRYRTPLPGLFRFRVRPRASWRFSSSRTENGCSTFPAPPFSRSSSSIRCRAAKSRRFNEPITDSRCSASSRPCRISSRRLSSDFSSMPHLITDPPISTNARSCRMASYRPRAKEHPRLRASAARAADAVGFGFHDPGDSMIG